MSGGRGRKRKVEDGLLNHDKLILWGKQYAVVVSPWAHSSMFLSSPPPNALEPNSVERFASFEAYQSGATSELLAFLSNEPEMQEQARSYAPFRERVCLNTLLSIYFNSNLLCYSSPLK